MKRLLAPRFVGLLLAGGFMLSTCRSPTQRLDQAEFEEVMNAVARGWSTQNVDLALSSFTPDAVYLEPPDIQYFRGHAQLRAYFGALQAQHRMEFHHLWFDEKSQSGVGEYTFSYGRDTADVGVAVVQLRDGKIAFWREYQRKGPRDFNQFIGLENKQWQWHIGNYP